MPAGFPQTTLASIDLDRPYWDDYRALLARLRDCEFPDTAALNRLLSPMACSGSGAPLRFVPARLLPAIAYERHLYETGEVSTREDSWHDLFNALVWCRLPRLKSALNALHYQNLEAEHEGRRGPRRDALTLLDESGAIIASCNRPLLEALASRDWERAFVGFRDAWRSDTRAVVCGHALLEKFLAPYKSMTAHALLLHCDAPAGLQAGEDFLRELDRRLGDRMMGGLCESPAALSPVPLAGIPGWWPDSERDKAFHEDRAVFRPAPPGSPPAPVHPL